LFSESTYSLFHLSFTVRFTVSLLFTAAIVAQALLVRPGSVTLITPHHQHHVLGWRGEQGLWREDVDRPLISDLEECIQSPRMAGMQWIIQLNFRTMMTLWMSRIRIRSCFCSLRLRCENNAQTAHTSRRRVVEHLAEVLVESALNTTVKTLLRDSAKLLTAKNAEIATKVDSSTTTGLSKSGS